jgi:hypothetical protein
MFPLWPIMVGFEPGMRRWIRNIPFGEKVQGGIDKIEARIRFGLYSSTPTGMVVFFYGGASMRYSKSYRGGWEVGNWSKRPLL